MPSIEQQVKDLNYKRLRSWDAAKAIVDRAEAEGRSSLNAEEKRGFDRANDEITKFDKQRDELLSSETAQREIETVNEEVRRVATPSERRDADRRDNAFDEFFRLRGPDSITVDLRNVRFMSDAIRDGMTGAELRVFQTDGGASGGSLTLPTTVERQVWSNFVVSNAMRRVGCSVITTQSGEPHVLPKITTHSIGTQIASQTTAVAGTDGVLGSTILSAYDYGELCAVSNDMIDDSGVDVAALVAQEIGQAIGTVTDTAYVLGGGSTAPTGIITAAPTGASGTVATGGTTIAGVNAISGMTDPFIDLQYSINDKYRQRGAGFLVAQQTAAVLRKTRETGGTTGQYLWSPSPTVGLVNGQPDRFLGDPIYVDTNVASIASNAKIAVYGDWSAFWIRDVQGLRLERSNDLYFNLNQVAFRGILRTDSNLVDTKALNVLKMSVA